MIFDEKEDHFSDNLTKYNIIKSNLSMTEKVIGFVPYHWIFFRVKFKGNVRKPKKITLFEEMICKIINSKNGCDIEMICKSLGFVDDTDIGFVLSIIEPLIKEGYIVLGQEVQSTIMGDIILDDFDLSNKSEQHYFLTEDGKNYLEKGLKFEYIKNQEFELIFDKNDMNNPSAAKIINELNLNENGINITSIRDIRDTFNDYQIVSHHAEVQAPNIHFPKNGFELDKNNFSFDENSIIEYSALVIACVLFNQEDETKRIIILHPSMNKILHYFNDIISKTPSLKKTIEKKLKLEITEEKKNIFQELTEKEIIELNSKIQIAKREKDIEKEKILTDKSFEIRRSFNTLEFESELERVFSTTDKEIWIFSPWIKKYTFRMRQNAIENLLKKKVKVFLIYSENDEVEGISNCDPEAEKILNHMSEKYPNLILASLPAFHSKKMYVITKKNNSEFIGSYNILSFFSKGNKEKVRQETMTRIPWDQESERDFTNDVKMTFNAILNKTIKNIDKLIINIKPDQKDFTKLLSSAYDRHIGILKLFSDYGIKEIDMQILQIQNKYDKIIKEKQ